MITKVVAKLKTGSIKSVVEFGSSVKPVAPYVVVKAEPALNQEIRFRVIAHMAKGNVTALETYILSEASTLLNGFAADDRFGNYFELEDRQEWMGVNAVSDDGTISMERSFYAPLILF